MALPAAAKLRNFWLMGITMGGEEHCIAKETVYRMQEIMTQKVKQLVLLSS